MRELPPTLTAVPGIRLRHEHFGALAWRTEPRKIFQLGHETATLLLLHDQPRSTAAVVTMGAVLGTPVDECRAILGGLYQQGVLVAVDAPPVHSPMMTYAPRLRGKPSSSRPIRS